MTFNELLLFGGPLGGVVAGAMVGHRISGIGGAVVGGVFGGLLLYLLARFCNFLARGKRRENLRAEQKD